MFSILAASLLQLAGSPSQPAPAVEVLRIGGPEAEGPYRLNDVQGVQLAGDQLFVLNGATNAVRVFDLQGGYVRSIGGEERVDFSGTRRLRIRGDTVFLQLPAKMERFGLDGSRLDSHPFQGEIELPTPRATERREFVGPSASGWLLELIRTDCGPEGADCLKTVGVESYDPASTRSVPLVEGREGARRVYSGSVPPASGGGFRPGARGRVVIAGTVTPAAFDADPAVGTDLDGNVYITDPVDYRVDVFSPWGEPVRSIENAHEPRSITEDDLERLRQCRTTSPSRDAAIRNAMAVARDDVFPAIVGLVVADDGAVWVRRGDVGDEPTRDQCADDTLEVTWDRFDADGRPAGSVLLPRLFEPFVLEGDTVYGLIWSPATRAMILGYRVGS